MHLVGRAIMGGVGEVEVHEFSLSHYRGIYLLLSMSLTGHHTVR